MARLMPVLLESRHDAADAEIRIGEVAGPIRHWGFLAHPDIPDRPGPAWLLVAIRPAPTLRHFDPEAVDYWVTTHGRGARRTLTHATPMPLSDDFSWGLIRLVDRLGVSNEYLTFGGRLDALSLDDVVVAAFASPAPLLRRGGHSQGWDAGADAVAAFFGRVMVAVDFTPGFESALASATPLTRYCAFVRDATARAPVGAAGGRRDDDLAPLLATEARRLVTNAPSDWAAAAELLAAATAPDQETGPAIQHRTHL
jgi:hypothetical protein